MTPDNFRQEIDAFLLKYQISATKFGVIAAGDTKFVRSVRGGRRVGDALKSRIRRWMAEWEAEG